MNPYSLTLIIVLSLVVVVTLIIFLFPKLQSSFHQKVDKSKEEIAKDEVESIIFDPEKNQRKTNVNFQKDEYLRIIEKKEKELGIIFSEDDIEALCVQLRQDQMDEGK